MISSKSNPVEWALWLSNLEDAREHLDNLIKEIAESGELEKEALAVDLGHIYAHLNRGWHSKENAIPEGEEAWEKASQFPTDVWPVG